MTAAKNIRQVIKANYLQPAFLICAGVLMITASAMSVSMRVFGFIRGKEPLPLKKSLSELDTSSLGPYKVVTKQDIDNPDVVETLGTGNYIKWTLEDTSAPEASNIRFCTLFITYYPLPDLVPHVPEECYIGGGLRNKNSETVQLTITPAAVLRQQDAGAGKSGNPEPEAVQGNFRQISARYLEFVGTQPSMLVGETTFPVLYVFSVNGQYAAGREDARLVLNRNLFGKYSYFSKVEWSFLNNSFGRVVYPKRQEALAASEKLLAVILPVLEKEHWPRPDNSGW